LRLKSIQIAIDRSQIHQLNVSTNDQLVQWIRDQGSVPRVNH